MTPDPTENIITIESMYGAASRTPFVRLVWGDKDAMLTPKEALAHAARIIEVAANADADAVFIRFLSERLGITDDEKIVAVLRDFRQMRS